MLVVAPRPLAPRRGGPKTLPVAPSRTALRAFTERHHLTPIPVVRAPARTTPRRRQIRPVDWAPRPVLVMAVPREAPIQRFRIVHAPEPEPAALPPPVYGPATSVGITATGGTRLIGMTPADLTQAGLVNITDFRLTLFAGVW